MDVVVVNAKVLTVDAKNTQAEAVAIRGNTFAAVGTTADIRKMAGPQTRVIDAGGRTVVPGFIESHVHATGAARGEVSQVFVQLHSIQEIKDWVREQAREASPGGWVRLPRVTSTRGSRTQPPGLASLACSRAPVLDLLNRMELDEHLRHFAACRARARARATR